ncbi:diaminopimelate dehydrogenase [Paramicrobacterium fandaimingii]|uniref:diaminopimelate dehydrogenase n=1 Tax=Paramicrobacterium fandaimingii TaxID=2708079 RepID=UPI00189EF800|nr:diaminopimelate dehydrogenase [Microbacterium fandaimingii]
MNDTAPTAQPTPASKPIRIGIAGYGNLGRGVEAAIAKNDDMSLVGIFTRRPPASIAPVDQATSVFAIDALSDHESAIDVLILCGGSKSDLPAQGPELAGRFNTVDSFDTHARIPEYFASVDAAATHAQKTALISTGWDPGVFSLNRLFGEALLPDGDTYTFWGRGLSQGHSDAVRRVPGVADAVQYTLPSRDAVDAVRSGVRPTLTTRQKHTRECFVVLEDGASAETVRQEIVTMPHYFAEYETTVTFITADELARDHSTMPHGGFVLRSGSTGEGHSQVIEYSLALESNPEFTASVLVAYSRAVHRMSQRKQFGAITVLDVPPGLLSPKAPSQLRAELL